MKIAKSVGKNIRRLRKRKDLLQRDLARLLNVSQNAISLYEKGKREPGIENLIKLCDIFDVSLDYLVGYHPDSRDGEADYSDGVCVVQGEVYALYRIDGEGGEGCKAGCIF